MWVYLAARYSRHPEMQQYAADLTAMGHEVCSRWIWGNHQVHRCALYMVATSAAQFDAGYVQAGRVRLHQGESGAALSAYDETNPGGYVDGWVIGCGQPVEESENLWAYPMLIGVAR